MADIRGPSAGDPGRGRQDACCLGCCVGPERLEACRVSGDAPRRQPLGSHAQGKRRGVPCRDSRGPGPRSHRRHSPHSSQLFQLSIQPPCNKSGATIKNADQCCQAQISRMCTIAYLSEVRCMMKFAESRRGHMRKQTSCKRNNCIHDETMMKNAIMPH